MIILKSPEMILISVSGKIGVQYINKEIIIELLMKTWFPKRQYPKTLTTVYKNVYFPDQFLLEQKSVILQFRIVHKINCAGIRLDLQLTSFSNIWNGHLT